MRQGFEEADRVADIVDLFEWNQAPPSALAAAVAPVIKGQGDETGFDEYLGVIAENERTDTGEAVAQDDAGTALAGLEPIRQKEVTFHPDAFTKKFNDAFFHRETLRFKELIR